MKDSERTDRKVRPFRRSHISGRGSGIDGRFWDSQGDGSIQRRTNNGPRDIRRNQADL